MKKLISILLIVVLIVSCMTFVGCEADVSLDEELFLNVGIRYTNYNDKTEVEYYTVSSKETLYLRYHTCKSIFVLSYGEPFYIKDGKTINLSSNERTSSFNFGEIKTKYVGDYTISETLMSGHEFSITLSFWDEKPAYEIEYIIEDNCINQENNRYVYKHNGSSNLPSVIISYENKKVCELTPLQLYRVAEIKKFNGQEFVKVESGTRISDVGIYQYTFYIEDVLPDEYKNKFRLMDNTTIIIEIVE